MTAENPQGLVLAGNPPKPTRLVLVRQAGHIVTRTTGGKMLARMSCQVADGTELDRSYLEW